MHTSTCKLSTYACLWLVPLFLLLTRPVEAQSVRNMLIKGKVVAQETNEGIPGVNVIIKNSKQGATTQADGSFSLNVPERPSVLLISYIGYQTQEVTVNAQTELTVSLQADTRSLNEVVVVGYGTQKKRDVTGAVSSLGPELFKERRETQVAQTLQGAMSGVVVTRSGGSGAMGGATIRIRGVTTIGNSDPLVMVDGIPVADVNQVNSADIENITVLKDAAAASIYGSRAASGVILITTKRAKADQVSIQYSYENGVDKPTRLPEKMGVVRYMELVNELRWNDAGNGTNQYPTFTKDLIDGYAEKNLADPNRFPDTDWVALTLRQSAPRETHSLSMMTGSKFIKSNASIRYEKVGGFYDNKDYRRIFARLNNDFTINKYIGATFDFNFKRTLTTDPTHGDPLGEIRIASPVYPAMWTDGRIADGKAGANVWARLKNGGTNQNTFNQISGRVGIDIKPIDGLKITGILAPIFDFNNQKFFNKRVDAFSATDPTQFVVTLSENGANATTRLSEGRNTNLSLTTQLLANYARTFGKHDITALAGYENFYNKFESLSASRDQYLFDGYPYLDQGPITFRDNSGGANETAYRSYFGRLTYAYADKYLLQANVRRDGSSRFNANYRWGVFPSFSAGWVISEEQFLKNQDALSFLKLRASWGTLGNERIGNYPYLGIISFGNALFYQAGAATSQQTAAQVQYAIEDISWETTTSVNLGLDANFFKDRLRLVGDVYQKETSDMLLALQIPIFVGFENPNQNTGKMNTKGIDLDLSWTDRVGDFRYSIAGNVSQFKSVMGDLGGTEFLGDQVRRQGSEFNEWYGYRSLGLFRTQEDVNNSPKQSTNVKVGDMKYQDISGPAGVPDGRISPEYDRVYLGGSLPQWTYGGTIRLAYKGLDLGMSIQGVGKQNSSMLGFTDYNAGNWGRFPNLLDGQTWSNYNTPEQNAAALYPRYTETNKGINRALSDFWLFNGGYMRLKNITVGYNIPERLARKALMKSCRVYVSGTDLWSLSNYPKGWDPEGLGIVTTLIGGVSVNF
ncbi:SusC/RagA family TonB-linked outer membrane protein [Fibrella aquatica]|uniref:SusC/RagA family TonB-linked outer membrane protein n=1 Tax=Fibrella aquatica TaxID=3242487 RepID=UPI0035229B54